MDNAKPLDMSNIINTRSKTITGDSFYVGEGILKSGNYFISLDSVCMVEMGRRQNSIGFYVLLIVIGIIICFVPYIRSYGVLSILVGILGTILTNIMNQKNPYSITIHLNNNMTCSFQSLNIEFMHEILDVIQSCINDRRGGYNILLNQGKIERNTITNNGGKFNYASDSGTINDSSREETIINNNGSKGLTAEDWVNLEKFFIMRQQEFPIGNRNYKICNNLATYTQRRDAGKIKGYLQTIGKEGIRMLLSAGTNVVDAVAMETVKPILQKILKLNG